MTPADDQTVVAMCALIGEVLDVTDVDADEDFFELGGTSLKAALVVAQIERRFGVRLVVTDLSDAATARALAARVGCPGPSGAQDPVVLVHYYPAALAGEIRRTRPVVVLSYGLDGDSGDGWPPPVGIDALAAHYVAQMRRARPTAPYHLVGYSLGGIIAWEMARQLGDEEVGLLCVIDAHPAEVRRRPLDKRSIVRRFAVTPPRILILRIRNRAIRAASKVSWAHRRLWARRDHGGRLDLIDHRLADYRMRPFGGRLLLIEGSRPAYHNVLFQPPPPLAEAYADLGLITGPHRLVEIQADHFAVIESPLARQVADAIDSEIAAT